MDRIGKVEPTIQQVLFDAIGANAIGQVRFMLKHIPTSYVNYAPKDGKTPLLQACMNGHLEMAQVLVENGATINTKDSEGNTCLHYAAMNEDHDMVRFLFDCCAGTFIRNNEGLLPVDLSPSEETAGIISERMMKDGPTEFVAACQRMNASGEMCNDSPFIKKQVDPHLRRISFPNMMRSEQCAMGINSVNEKLKKRRVSAD